jgi:glycerol-3-phosphate dehydrogenase (NAD(P)+)
MDQEHLSEATVGVVGAGSFGICIANLLSENVSEVLLYTRRAEVFDQIENKVGNFSQLNAKVKACRDLELMSQKCQLIFPVIPSKYFRELMRNMSPYLITPATQVKEHSIKTMSQVIEEETSVCRIGCLSGPNLSSEILAEQPAATLLASKYTEVIKLGQQVLRCPRFQVYGTHDIMGAELAGVLKNVIALAAGLLGGIGMGKNLWALLITRGLSEMIHIGKAMGADTKAFLGVAGIGDLVATAAGTQSRNYNAGYRIAKGEKLEDILNESAEMVEGLKTLETIHFLCQQNKINAPIFEVTYRVIYKGLNIDRAIQFLMTYPYEVDVDFM